MDPSDLKLNPNIHCRIGNIQMIAQSNNEATNIAYEVSVRINEYSRKLHDALNNWHHSSQEIKDLLSSSTLTNISTAIKGLKDAANKTPPKPPGYNTIPAAESMALYNLLKGQSEAFLSSIPITGFKITYETPSGKPGPPIQGDPGDVNMETLVWDVQNIVIGNGNKLTGITIDVTPSQAQQDLNKLNSLGEQAMLNPEIAAEYNKLMQEISQLQSDIKNDMLQVMYFFSAMKSNEKSLSSILKTLNSIAETGFRSVGS